MAVTMREMLESGGHGWDSAAIGATPGDVPPVHEQTRKGGGGDIGSIEGARDQTIKGTSDLRSGG